MKLDAQEQGIAAGRQGEAAAMAMRFFRSVTKPRQRHVGLLGSKGRAEGDLIDRA